MYGPLACLCFPESQEIEKSGLVFLVGQLAFEIPCLFHCAHARPGLCWHLSSKSLQQVSTHQLELWGGEEQPRKGRHQNLAAKPETKLLAQMPQGRRVQALQEEAGVFAS